MAYHDKVLVKSGLQWPALKADLLLVVVYSLIAAIAVFLPIVDETIIRTVLGLGMVIFVPGYALMAALFPGKKTIDSLERIVLSFAMSIAVIPLMGLVLNFTPIGIRLESVIVSLTFFSVSWAIVANERRNALAREDRFGVDLSQTFKKLATRVNLAGRCRLDGALNVILLFSIIVSIAMIAYMVATPDHRQNFTEFYILGPEGMAEDYPTEMTTGERSTITVGVVNHEYRDVRYDLVIQLNGSGNVSHLHSERFVLRDNQTWENVVNIRPDRAGQNMTLQFLLYADGNMTVAYRDLLLWIDIAEPAS